LEDVRVGKDVLSQLEKIFKNMQYIGA